MRHAFVILLSICLSIPPSVAQSVHSDWEEDVDPNDGKGVIGRDGRRQYVDQDSYYQQSVYWINTPMEPPVYGILHGQPATWSGAYPAYNAPGGWGMPVPMQQLQQQPITPKKKFWDHGTLRDLLLLGIAGGAVTGVYFATRGKGNDAAPSISDQWINPYQRRNGTWVNGHWRSRADGLLYNNFSRQGNINPYTGQPGWIPSP